MARAERIAGGHGRPSRDASRPIRATVWLGVEASAKLTLIASLTHHPVVVVGAGLAGITVARTLHDAEVAAVVVDKGRSVGGRLATRRIAEATLDHGAQFFTVRTDAFAAEVAEAMGDDVVFEWCRGFGANPDGHPRHGGRGGMNRWAKHLAQGLEVSVGVRIEQLVSVAGGWELRHADGAFAADAVVLTAPMPQNLELLDAGGTELDARMRERLEAITYHPTLALLLALDGPPDVPPPGGVQQSDGPFSFIADNRAKGISSGHALTLHVRHELSRERWDDDPATVRDELLASARPWIGSADVVECQLKRWRYAQPIDPLDAELEATERNGAPLVFAGDAFAGSKVEGAFRSGRAAALRLIDRHGA